MNIWKLSILNDESRDWNASTYKGEVFVRAESEHDARKQATLAFTIATERKLGKTTAVNPWSQGSLVSCESVEDERYEIEGNTRVLSPELS